THQLPQGMVAEPQPHHPEADHALLARRGRRACIRALVRSFVCSLVSAPRVTQPSPGI
ncbi:hypothetical protein KEM52_002483, partial [Ascosphaera acerosa]